MQPDQHYQNSYLSIQKQWHSLLLHQCSNLHFVHSEKNELDV